MSKRERVAAAYDAAMRNATTEKGRILVIGNPIRRGRVYELFQRPHWARFKTSAFDTPNVKAGETVRTGFPGPDWPAELERARGADPAFYQSSVLAEFPKQRVQALVDLDWLEAAAERHEASPDLPPETSVVVALDPSGGRPSASALAIRRGNVLEEVPTLEGPVDSV